MATSSQTTARPCPTWCTLPPDHDLNEPYPFDPVEDARIHYPPVSDETSLVVMFNDNPLRPRNTDWAAEIVGVEMQEDSPADLALQLRWRAAGLTTAAEWLEALPVTGPEDVQ